MAYALEGAEGSVTSWGAAGFYNTMLSKMMPNRANLTIVGDRHESTIIGAFVQSAFAGLRSWDGTIESLVSFGGAGRVGNVGVVTWGAGGDPATPYVTHLFSWDLLIESAVHDVTNVVAPTSGPTWRAFRPSYLKATGTYRARVDNSTSIVTPTVPATALPTLALTFGDEAADDTITFAAGIVGDARFTMARGEITGIEYDFEASGSITPAGTSNPLGTSALTTGPLWSQGGATTNTLLTLTSVSTKTYAGDAFYKAVRIHCEVGEPVTFSVDFQGTGALTIA